MHVSQSSEPERHRDVSIHLAPFVVRGKNSNGGACVVMRRELFVLLAARTHFPSLWAKARWSPSSDIYMMQKDYVLSQNSLDLTIPKEIDYVTNLVKRNHGAIVPFFLKHGQFKTL